MLTGGYPRILDQGFNPSEWLGAYGATYVERDVRAVKRVGDLTTFQRFLELCAGRSAQLLNLSSLATDCGVSQPTAKAWLSVLETGFILFPLRAFPANTRKRLVKMPKLHFFDTGLLCWLLGIRAPEQLRAHPLRGPIFETWVVSEIAKRCQHRDAPYRLSFYRSQVGRDGLACPLERDPTRTKAFPDWLGAARLDGVRRRGQLDDRGRSSDFMARMAQDNLVGSQRQRPTAAFSASDQATEAIPSRFSSAAPDGRSL